jgi:formylglycine-generating enzyme required for sulfatase activity
MGAATLMRWQARTQAFVERCDGLTLTMLRIPAGRFVMGSPEAEPKRQSSEGPQHEVTLGEYLMAQTPITQAQWREVANWQAGKGERWGRELKPEPSFFQPRSHPEATNYGSGRFSLLETETSSDHRPVDNVNWHDAMEFCHRLSQRTGRFYTLPSEAQWEYACRAGTTAPFAFGATLTDQLANYRASSTYADGPKGEHREQTTPVGKFPANAWGLYDMHGNVWEWCLDQWHESYEGAPSDGSAWQDPNVTDKESRLLRGGSWSQYPRSCRSAYRNHDPPDDAYGSSGLRVVCLPQDPSLNA